VQAVQPVQQGSDGQYGTSERDMIHAPSVGRGVGAFQPASQ
jgi:hypothetical protein